MTPLILLVLFVAFGVCTLRTFFLFDEILRKEYAEHPEAWEQDGKPIGFFWVPKEGEILSGSVARSGLFLKWAFSRPSWAEPRADLIPLFAKLRRSLIVGICIWAVSMVVLFSFPK